MNIDALPERIARRIAFDGSGCWHWTGYCNPKGYSKVYWDGDMRLAHRVVYEVLVGPIPKGMSEVTIDHLCRVRHCVNPDHMELVSNRTNILRGESPAAVAHVTDTCLRGLHPLDGDNAYVHPQRGTRECKACRRVREKTRL